MVLIIGAASALAVLAIAVGWAILRDSKSDEERIAELLRQESAAIDAGDWSRMYGYTDPEFRARCSQDEMAAALEPIRAERRNEFGPGEVTVVDLKVKLEGDRANATYVVEVGEQSVGVVTEARPDTFRKVDGDWRDVDETPDDCAI